MFLRELNHKLLAGSLWRSCFCLCVACSKFLPVAWPLVLRILRFVSLLVSCVLRRSAITTKRVALDSPPGNHSEVSITAATRLSHDNRPVYLTTTLSNRTVAYSDPALPSFATKEWSQEHFVENPDLAAAFAGCCSSEHRIILHNTGATANYPKSK